MIAQADEILTLEEAAAFLRVSEEAILDLLARHEIPARKIGGEWRFLKGAILDWLRFGLPTSGENSNGMPPWLLEYSSLDELLLIVERRMKQPSTQDPGVPRRGSREAMMQHFGIYKEDDDLEARLAEVEAQRKVRSR